MSLEQRNLQGGFRAENMVTIQEKNSSGKVIRTYLKGKMLGKGGFAKCYELLSEENNKKFAVKIIEKATLTRSKAREKLNSQIKIHRSLKSGYVVKFHHFFEDDLNVYIILELCSNQTLNELIKRRRRITELEAKYYLHQLALGIKDIHDQKVIHRDLKLGNLFLNQKLEIKIGDFGLAALLTSNSEKRRTMCGTPNYIAPEILENTSGHSYEVDIWSLGVIAYAFVVGRPPFETNDIKATYSKIKNCNYSFPDTISLSKVTKKFIAKMLMREPSRRATLDQILNDQFFTAHPFPQTLPMSLLACPPNSAFLKQFNDEPMRISQSSRGASEKKQGKQTKESINTDRFDRKEEKQSLGRVLVRAASIDRVDKKNTVTRASSTAALMGARRNQNMTNNSSQQQNSIALMNAPKIWVTYSEDNPKFGVCYMLNSGATGMKFNDSTCLISNSNFTKIKYYPSLRDARSGEAFQIHRTPEGLTKKMKIIVHYQKELRNRKQHEQRIITNDERINRERLRFRETEETMLNFYVVKHEKNTKVDMFWFNNKDYQVIFKDSTQLLVSKENYITYINKLSQRKYFLKSELEEQPEEIKKRMSYTLNLIERLRQNRQRHQESQQNKQNVSNVLVRSSSQVKIEKKAPMMRSIASMTKLPSYKLSR